jgi:opacity protein-like surface antigen
LIYATAGAAIAHASYSSPAVAATLTRPAFVSGKKNVINIGPQLGVGVEQKVTEQLCVKGEVEVASFGTTRLTLPAGRTSVESAQLSAKVGLNYNF